MSRVIVNEPRGITPDLTNYTSALPHAFNFYNQDKDKKFNLCNSFNSLSLVSTIRLCSPS